MINDFSVFDLVGTHAGLWCGVDLDATDMANAVHVADVQKIPMISVAPGMVQTVWPWLENSCVKIMTRFYLEGEKISENQISDITVRINTALRQGASGAQVFLSYAALEELVEQTYIVRDDLFFNKDLAIGMDISDVGPFDWENVFENLRKINASSVIFVFARDDGNKSDFVGRIYAMLNAWGAENKFDLHFAFGPNFMRIEQAQRLVQQIRPNLVGQMCFWVNA